MRAKYGGICTNSGKSYPAGTEIVFGPHGWAIAGEKAPNIPEDAIRVSKGEGYGGEPYYIGQIFQHKSRDGESRILYVVHASQTYYKEDGMSFGVGDEQGYIFSASCRPATDEEAAPMLEEIRLQKERFNRNEEFNRRFHEAFGQPAKDREYPWGENNSPLCVEGQTIPIRGGGNIYGGGSWMVIDADGAHIWHVENNGHDGDDWSYNNVQTGGAGAIGHRYPLTEERAAIVELLKTINQLNEDL